jgi:hypothetical protein
MIRESVHDLFRWLQRFSVSVGRLHFSCLGPVPIQEMHIEKLGRVVRAGNLLSFTGCRLNDIGTFQEFWSAEGTPAEAHDATKKFRDRTG